MPDTSKLRGAVVADIIAAMDPDEMTTGEKASLRRLQPGGPDWRSILEAAEASSECPSKFGNQKMGDSSSHGIALMAHGSGLAHRPRIAVGQALFLGGESRRERGFYSEDRLSALLSSRGSTLHRLLARLFRMLANEGSAFNWREMAWFILNEGHNNEEEADKSRVEIARAYYRAQSSSQQPE